MPPIPQRRSERLAFRDGFRRSRKGNLWRPWQGSTLVIFERDDGWYGWLIAHPDGEKTWAPEPCESEEEAVEALRAEIEEWE